MKPSVEIRKMTHDDVEILSSIQKQAFLPLYERYHDAGNPFLRGPEDILRRLDNPIFHPFTILCDGDIAGGLWYRSLGGGMFFEELGPGEYYLQRVFILPEKQGRKIAQKAIKLAEESLEGAKRFYVDFPADLEKNRRCYEAAGYQDTGARLEVEPGLTLAAYEKSLNN